MLQCCFKLDQNNTYFFIKIQMRLFKSSLRYFSIKKKKEKVVVPQILTPQQLKSMKLFKRQNVPLQQSKILPQSNKRNTLITAALPYVNNVPHLGNIIGALLSADVIARYKRLKGQNVLFICGTDQYGTATQVKAKQSKKTPKQICDQYFTLHKQIYEWFNISYNHFGRTSSPIHTQVVQEIFSRCYQNGFFIQKQTHQLYCNSCEMFLADRFIVGTCKYCKAPTKADQCDSCNKVFTNPQHQLQNCLCSICKDKPQLRSTSHLFFNFQHNEALKQRLRSWLQQNNRIEKWSNNAKGQTRNWLKENNLKDRCMTRDLKWGVKVPLEKFIQKVLYVWFDAPIGYLSMTKDLLGQEGYTKWWHKSDDHDVELIQFMGKDNILFHSVLFPATLLQAQTDKVKYNLVNKLCVTEYLRYEGGKFSKSQNRGVFGNECVNTQIQSDVWRYYLLSNRPQNFDCEFIWQQFGQKNNKQLMNSMGNLYNRILKVARKDFNGSIPPLLGQATGDQQRALMEQLKLKVQKYFRHLENNEIKGGTQSLLEISYLLNKYVQDTEFWKAKQRKTLIISFLLRCLTLFGHLLQPYLPTTSARVYYLLGLEDLYNKDAFKQIQSNFEAFLHTCLDHSTGLKQPLLLFTEISAQKINTLSVKFGKSTKNIQIQTAPKK